MNWISNIDLKTVAGVITALITLVFTAFKLVEKYSLQGYLRKLFNIEPGITDLKDAFDNMSNIVYSQGTAIDWLTSSLVSYREELAEAKEQLKAMEEVQKENINLRVRVAELEAQVKALEEELARRKKYTPKKFKEEE